MHNPLSGALMPWLSVLYWLSHPLNTKYQRAPKATTTPTPPHSSTRTQYLNKSKVDTYSTEDPALNKVVNYVIH